MFSAFVLQISTVKTSFMNDIKQPNPKKENVLEVVRKELKRKIFFRVRFAIGNIVKELSVKVLQIGLFF